MSEKCRNYSDNEVISCKLHHYRISCHNERISEIVNMKEFLLILIYLVEIEGFVKSCDKSRQVLTENHGFIQDGITTVNYTQNTHCEWLIKANNSGDYISLKFLQLDTECGYDYVFVYDGDSMHGTLLGSFSGKIVPSTIVAKSGKYDFRPRISIAVSFCA